MASVESRRAAVADGEAAERFVAERLRADGWQVLAHRWRGAAGELDLVVERRRCLRIVEVKLRQPDDPVGLEAITAHKLARIERAAEAWLQDHDGGYDEVCLMVALVERSPGGWTIQWFDDPV